jgi:hypothetical protein
MSWNQNGYNTNWNNWGGKQTSNTPTQPDATSNNYSQSQNGTWTWVQSNTNNNSWGSNNTLVQPMASLIWQYSNQWPQNNQQQWSQNNQYPSLASHNSNTSYNNNNNPPQNSWQNDWQGSNNTNHQN